jgi:hypothetical protein
LPAPSVVGPASKVVPEGHPPTGTPQFTVVMADSRFASTKQYNDAAMKGNGSSSTNNNGGAGDGSKWKLTGINLLDNGTAAAEKRYNKKHTFIASILG